MIWWWWRILHLVEMLVGSTILKALYMLGSIQLLPMGKMFFWIKILSTTWTSLRCTLVGQQSGICNGLCGTILPSSMWVRSLWFFSFFFMVRVWLAHNWHLINRYFPYDERKLLYSCDVSLCNLWEVGTWDWVIWWEIFKSSRFPYMESNSLGVG